MALSIDLRLFAPRVVKNNKLPDLKCSHHKVVSTRVETL